MSSGGIGKPGETKGKMGTGFQFQQVVAQARQQQKLARQKQQLGGDEVKQCNGDADVTTVQPPTWWRRIVVDDGPLEQCYRNMGIEHWGIVLLVILYASLGGAIFSALEGPAEMRRRAELFNQTNHMTLSIYTSVSRLYNTSDDDSVDRKLKEEVRKAVLAYQDSQDVNIPTQQNWDFWGAVFYAATLFTTIGYGHYSPKTVGGRVASMFYALIGIPLVLVMLNDLGKMLIRIIQKPWNTLRKCTIRCWRYGRKKYQEKKQLLDPKSPSKIPLATDEEQARLDEGRMEDGNEKVEETNFILPIPMACLLFFIWIVFSALIVQLWEDWDFFTAFYFYFISLTTIGLGDVVPDHPKYMLAAFPLVLMGLSLISMVFNLIQQKMEKFKEEGLDMLEDQLGWETDSSSSSSDSEDEDGKKRRGKMTPPPKVQKTSPERDPNLPNLPGVDKDKLLDLLDKDGATTPTKNYDKMPTLGIFSGAGGATGGSSLSLKKLNSVDEKAFKKRCLQQGLNPTKVLTSWQSKANRRKRRGVQTDESYIRQMKAQESWHSAGHHFPHSSFLGTSAAPRLRNAITDGAISSRQHEESKATQSASESNKVIQNLDLILPSPDDEVALFQPGTGV